MNMLANHPTESRKNSVFFVVVHTDREVAELMAQCAKCGGVTSYALELAWRLRSVICSECTTSMRLSEDELRRLRERLVRARVRVDQLLGDKASPEPDEPVSHGAR
jgi:hypothetical protein